MQHPPTQIFAAICKSAIVGNIRGGERRWLIPPVSTISTPPKTVGDSRVGGILASYRWSRCMVAPALIFLMVGREASFLKQRR